MDIANLNVQTTQSAVQNAGSTGLQYTVYYLARDSYGNAITNGVACTGVWNSNSMSPGSATCGRSENFIVKFTGIITVPSHWTSTKFAGYTDDGFRMYIDGTLAIDNWVEQGKAWSPYSPIYDVTTDKVFDVEIWWYNGGGPGYYHLGWAIPGGWTGAGCDYTGGWGVGFSCDLNTFSYGQGATQAQIDAYNQAVSEQQSAQTTYNEMLAIYNNKLSYYNQQNSILNDYTQTFNEADQNLQTSQSNLTTASENLTQSQSNYEVSILDMQNAIVDAQEEYSKQWQFEESQRVAAAIAQALANQPKSEPTPEPEPTPQETIEPEPTLEPEESPSSEPTPDPQPTEAQPDPQPTEAQPDPDQEKPEQTEPDSPNPEPTDQIDDESSVTPNPEPEQSPEPQPEPTPQQTDIDPLPTPSPQPEPTPVAPSPKPSQPNNTTIDLSRVIANLTSKDNVIVKLTSEQMQAVGNTLATLSTEAKVEAAKDLGVRVDEVKILAEAAQENPAVAAAIVTFAEKAEENTDAPMPYTIADAITEAAAELFLEDPLAVFATVDLEELSDPSQWGKDMTDDQREKAQEVIVPVILVSNIISSVASTLTRRV